MQYPKYIILMKVGPYCGYSLEEIINIGIEEYIYSDAITVIEWSERLKDFLPKGRIEIKINSKFAEKQTILPIVPKRN